MSREMGVVVQEAGNSKKTGILNFSIYGFMECLVPPARAVQWRPGRLETAPVRRETHREKRTTAAVQARPSWSQSPGTPLSLCLLPLLHSAVVDHHHSTGRCYYHIQYYYCILQEYLCCADCSRGEESSTARHSRYTPKTRRASQMHDTERVSPMGRLT
jgi:hypothetical protein